MLLLLLRLCELLCEQRQFGRLKRVLLRHRVFRATQAVEDEFAEEREADFSGAGHAVLALPVEDVELVYSLPHGDIQVFA